MFANIANNLGGSCLQAGVALRRESLGETLAGLQEMLMYGLKGMAAYTHHAGRCQGSHARIPATILNAVLNGMQLSTALH